MHPQSILNAGTSKGSQKKATSYEYLSYTGGGDWKLDSSQSMYLEYISEHPAAQD